MKTTFMLLVAASVAGAMASPAEAENDLRPMVVTTLSGTLRVQQGVPCDDVDVTTAVTGGRIEVTPAEGIAAAGGGTYFTLTRANVSFAPFAASGSCLGFGQTRNYGTVHTQLIKAVSFTAAPTATPGVFSVTIPRDQFVMSYATLADGEVESGTKLAAEDVTGTIDLAAGTIQIRVVLATQVTFRAGCVGDACIIDETDGGTLTANVSGAIAFPDTDTDGVPDRADNCRFVANPDQTTVATPTIAPPPNLTLASCLSREFGFARGADVCDATHVTVTSNAPSPFALGANTVTWTARDGLSRTATADQTVTIVDTTRPAFSFVPVDIAMNDCGPASLGLATATDDCAGTVTVGNNAPPKFFVGTTPVTWTATDVSGNSTTALQNVTVVDTVAPTAACVPAGPPGGSFQVSAVDSCTSAPVIRLGSYVLADGEVIKINETGQPGVRFINTVAGIRHFHVGKGEAVITATDESGNVGTAACARR